MRYKIFIALIFLNAGLFAQTKDTRELFKKFVTVCNAYKEVPLQLDIDYKKSSNIPLNKDDSSAMHGVFYIQAAGAYIRFGDAEQLISDSFTLIVMNNINQMVLSKSNVDITSQVTNMINMPVNAASVKNLSEKYDIQEKPADNETSILQISDKQNLYNTDLPAEAIILTYKTKNNDPIKVETIKRTLVKKPAEGDAPFAAKVISIPQKGDYFIKEDVTDYVYKSIRHEAGKRLPVTPADRVQKDSSGTYVPVKAYSNYKLIIN